MLKVRYRTLVVEYDNHTDLFKTNFEKVVKLIENILCNVENRVQKNCINGSYYASVRLKPNSYLILYTQPNNKINLYILHSDGKTYSFQIKGEDFEKLLNPYILFDLEDKCKNIERNFYTDQNLVTKEIQNVIDELPDITESL